MVGADEIGTMQKGSFLVNTARGGIVDTEAVVNSLGEGHLTGAGIDVLEKEPPPEDSVVLAAWRDAEHPAHDRLILNPHTAFYCEEGCEEFRTRGASGSPACDPRRATSKCCELNLLNRVSLSMEQGQIIDLTLSALGKAIT